MKVLVETETRCEYSHRSPEEYGTWEELNTFSIKTVREAKEADTSNYHSDVFNIADGSSKCYILWMVYTSGDSFGRSYGNGDILHAFGNREVAEMALKDFEAQKENYSIKILDDFGQEISLHNLSYDYFGGITDLCLDTFDLAHANIRIKF